MTEIKNKIAIEKIDYSNEVIENFFLKKEAKKSSNIKDYNEILENFLEDIEEQDVLCIMTTNIESIGFIKNLKKLIREKKVIVFIVSHKNEKLKELKKLAKIRLCENLPDTTFILKKSSKQIQGLIFSGGIKDTIKNYVLNLNENQNQEMNILFCKYFWEKSQEEMGSDEKKKLEKVYNNIEMYKPYYKPEEKKETFLEFLNNSDKNYIIYNNEFENLSRDNQLVITKDNIENIDEIMSFNNEVFLSLNGKKANFFINEEEGYFISDLDLKEKSFFISLDDTQRNEAELYFKDLIDSSEYQFIKEENIECISKEFFYRDLNKKKEVLQEVKKTLPQIITEDIEKFENFDLISKIYELEKFDRENPSLECEYTLEVKPPRLPNNSEKASLVKEWEKTKDKFNKKLISYEEILSENKEKLDKYQNFISKFNLFKIGRKKKISDFEKSIKKLREEDIFKLSFNEQKKFLKSFEDLKEVEKYSSDLERSIDEDKKEKKWLDRKKNIEETIKDLKNKKNELEKEKNELEKEKEKEEKKSKDFRILKEKYKKEKEKLENKEKELKKEIEKVKELKKEDRKEKKEVMTEKLSKPKDNKNELKKEEKIWEKRKKEKKKKH